MRFVEFLKTTVLLSGGAATALALLAVLSAAAGASAATVWVTVGWWVLACAVGLWIGRRSGASPAIARLLAAAKPSTALPEQHPGRILMNRLWPLLALTVLAGAVAFLAPQVPAIGTGFALIWALSWRRQHSAVAAIEQRDGVCFYVMHTSPVRPIALQRTPGFKAMQVEPAGGALR